MSNVKPISVRDLIQSLGGPTTVAKRLGYSVQRVSNWSSRNAVPAHVCLDHPDIFAATVHRSAYAGKRALLPVRKSRGDEAVSA